MDKTGRYSRFSAPARAHWGLFNESGLYGRVDGGAGVALSSPHWSGAVSLASQSGVRQTGGAFALAYAALDQLAAQWGTPSAGIQIDEFIPSHVGLGSKTSLLLGLGLAYAAVANVHTDVAEISRLLGRGGTSGVGVNTAASGLIVLDDGHRYPEEKSHFGPSSLALAPPPTATVYKPDPTWKIIHMRLDRRGISGQQEVRFFEESCPIPNDETCQILELVDKVLRPALETNHLRYLHMFLEQLQELGLKKREWQIQGTRTKEFASRWRKIRRRNSDLSPACLSSVGPTITFITENPERELAALRRIGISRNEICLSAIDGDGVQVERAFGRDRG